MKKISTLFMMMFMMVACAVAQTLPIYMDELITEAPEGTVVSGCQRSCFSYYYSGGVQGGYNDGFVGEYVLGNDGNIYLKQPCASLAYTSYLKLEKVSDEASEHFGEYVCHTAQCVYVYDSGTAVYTYFATRLVYTKHSDTSYGYSMETDAQGKVLADVYFTLDENGVLKQNCQETVNMNGEILPVELIGFTNQSGQWVGFGDACIIVKPVTVKPVELPEGADVKQGSFAYNSMSSTIGENVRNAMPTQYAEVGDTFYMLSPLDGKNWIVGNIDRVAGTVTFQKQYAGINESIGCHEWIMPATYKDWFDEWDAEDHTGTWTRDYAKADAIVCKYENGSIVCDESLKQTLVFSLSDTELQRSGVYADFAVRPANNELRKPATPRVLKFEPVEETFFWGELWYAISPVDENDTYINTDELYYNVYLNNAEKPFTFTNDDYAKIPGKEMTDIAFNYDDDSEFDHTSGAFHNLYFYEWGVTFAGIQAIHRKDGKEMRSEIGWYGYTANAIDGVNNWEPLQEGKVLENGRVVILRGGQKYNLNGQRIK